MYGQSAPSMRLRPSSIVAVGAIILFLFLIASYNYKDDIHTFANSHSKSSAKHPALTNQFDLPENQNWTHIIWETSKYPTETQSDEDRARSKTWAEKNPYYRHEMITHERMLGYCEDTFRHTHPELVEVYHETKDYMLRTDVLRYMLLLKDGGVYNDLDVDCIEPIDTWLPEQFKDKAGMVMGIETDHKEGEGWIFQLAVWTMMSKPNQPFVRFVLDRLMENMRNVSAEQQAALSQTEVLLLTGPAATTVDFIDYAALVTGTNVTYKNFSLITEPVLIGEVVLLPIWAFGADHQVHNSGFSYDNGKPLVKHHFANSWKTDHKDVPP